MGFNPRCPRVDGTLVTIIMITEFIKLKPKELKLIEIYIIENFDNVKSLFLKLKKYTSVFNDKNKITNEEVKLFNNIPVPEKYKLKTPIEIFRGVALSDKMIKTVIVKFKKEKKKFKYKPIKTNYSGWSFSKNIANDYSTGVYADYNFGLIFESTITNKNKFIDIGLFYLICQNLRWFKKEINKKISEGMWDELQVTSRYSEEEVLVFGKLQVTNISKTK